MSRLAIVAILTGIATLTAIGIQMLLTVDPFQDFGVPLPLHAIAITSFISKLLRDAADALQSPPNKVLDDYKGLFKSQILYACSRLNIADLLAKGSKSTVRLASLTNTESPTLLRLLRAAESIGYFEQDKKTGMWDNSFYSELLRSEHPSSVSLIIQHWNEDVLVPWSRLVESIEGNEISMFEKVHGSNMDKYFNLNYDKGQLYLGAMGNLDALMIRAEVDDFQWAQCNRVVDIGGSYGTFLFRILNTYPQIKGFLYDVSDIVDQARHVIMQQDDNIQNRIKMSSGSFFEPKRLPKLLDGDCLLLRNILHNWNDENALKILSSIRTALGNKTAQLIVVEAIVPEVADIRSPSVFISDLHQLVTTLGQQRSREQFTTLFASAGFQLESVHTTRSVHSVVVASPK